MSKNKGPVAAINSDESEVRERMERSAKRRQAFGVWIAGTIGYPDPSTKNLLWEAFKAGCQHGRENE